MIIWYSTFCKLLNIKSSGQQMQMRFVAFKLYRYSNISSVLPESRVPYSDILISLLVFTLSILSQFFFVICNAPLNHFSSFIVMRILCPLILSVRTFNKLFSSFINYNFFVLIWLLTHVLKKQNLLIHYLFSLHI